MTKRADIVIIGAGIAGASLAAEVAGHASVLLIESEAPALAHKDSHAGVRIGIGPDGD